MADVLSGGGGPAHPGRWLAGLAVVALALGLPALLRSGPDAPAPDRAVTVVAPPTRSTVVSVAVGNLYAYALVSTCDGRIVHECDYRVHRRDFRGPGWRRLDLHVAGRTTTSLDVTLLVTPDDRVTLVDGTGGVHASADGGDTITTTHLRAGPPVADMPRGSVLAAGLCESCDTTVTVLDPATGELHRLAAQPAFRGFGVRLAQADGPVLWAADIGPGGAATAVSGDAGRSWRLVPLAPGLVLTAPVALASRPGGGAYLVGRRAGSQLPDVRRIDSPAGSWRRFTPPTGPVSAYSAVIDERGLLVGDADGRAWRLMGDGSFLELATTAGFLAGGPGRVLLGLPPTPGTVLLSYDGGVSWKAEHVG